MNKLTLLTVLLLLFLTSCSTGPFRNDTSAAFIDFHQGREGLTLEFVEQAPPTSVREGDSFDVQVAIHNKGAFDLTDMYAATLRLRETDISQARKVTQLTPQPDNYVSGEGIQLLGKSLNFPSGELYRFAIDRYQATSLTGKFETNTADFSVELCYPYQTLFSDTVCIDTNIDGSDPRFQSCTAQDQSYGKGQGGPLTVTGIESQMRPIGVYLQPQFTIYVEHVGDGFVERFSRPEQTRVYGGGTALTCGQPNIAYEEDGIPVSDINTFDIVARLAGRELVCDPGIVTLFEDKAKIFCTLESSEILVSSSSYESLLEIDLIYQYREDFSTSTIIQRNGFFSFAPRNPVDENDCYPWETFNGRECADNCRVQALAGAQGPFEELNSPTSDVPISQLIQYAGCTYSSAESCRANKDLCTLEDNLCPPGSYCGFPKCIGNNKDPDIIDLQHTRPGEQIRFYCRDRDDEDDLTGACGCDEVAYYQLVPRSQSCDDISLGNWIAIQQDNESFIPSYELRLPPQTEEDMHLCVRVFDRLGASDTLRERDPYDPTS